MNTIVFTIAVSVASALVTWSSIKWMRQAKEFERERYKPVTIPVWVTQHDIGVMMIEEMLVGAFVQAMTNAEVWREDMAPSQKEQLVTDLLEISHSYAEGMVRRYTDTDFD